MVLEEVDLNYIYSVLQEDPNDFSVLKDIEWRLSNSIPKNWKNDTHYQLLMY